MHLSGPLLLRLNAGHPDPDPAGVHVGCYEVFGTDKVLAIGDLRGKRVGIRGLDGPEHVFLWRFLNELKKELKR